MISFKEFKAAIDEYKKFEEAITRVGNALHGDGPFYGSVNLFECDWYASVDELFDIFVKSHFTETGCDVIYWWLFEDVDHVIYQSVDPDLFDGNKEIEYDVNDLKDLWDYFNIYKKDYFKDV